MKEFTQCRYTAGWARAGRRFSGGKATAHVAFVRHYFVRISCAKFDNSPVFKSETAQYDRRRSLQEITV